MDRKKGSRKVKVSDLFMILFLSSIAYLSAGFLLSYSYLDSRLMVIGFLAFFIGVAYDYWAINIHLKKQKTIEDRITKVEENIQSILEILQKMKDIFKIMK